jgi:two-component system sensor histidine kinase/response regulator
MDTSLPLLVVDDNQQMRLAVKSILGDLGHDQVYLAGSGEEACRILRERPIAAVISDLDMPGMDGLQLLRWVREHLSDAKLPFMLLPGDANQDDIRAAAQAGVSAYLIKPFTLASFHAKLQALLQPSTVPGRPAQPARPPASQLIGMERPLDERIREATVLVVDDMATNIKVIAGMLAEEGYGIKVAITGRKALEMATAQPPHIILLDVMMPEMDGFEVCRQLKANPATAAIPVIFLSAKDQADDIVGGLELGAVDYVTKPVDPAILKARLRTHLRLAGMMTELRRQNAALADNAALREELDQLTRYDLTVPLVPLLDTCAQLLAAAGTAPAQRAQLQALDLAARHTLRLASLALEVRRIEYGVCLPRREAVPLHPLLARAAHDSMGEHPLILPAQPLTLLADPALCLALFEHLLRNAAAAAPALSSIVITANIEGSQCVLTLEHAGVLAQASRAGLAGTRPAYGDDAALAMYAAGLLAQVQGGALELPDEVARTRLTVRLPAA